MHATVECGKGPDVPSGSGALSKTLAVKPLFPASANAIYWLAIGAIALGALAVPTFFILWARTPYSTGQGEPVIQPVKFDHRHHVRDVGIDCLYCHNNAKEAPYAGVPATSVCMGCHGQIWTESPELAPVRASYFEQKPLVWQRVNSLPDFVFFDHSIHVKNGVGCVSCHGRVDQMGHVYQDKSLTMGFCLDCHRNPEPHLRPLDRVTDMEWAGPPATNQVRHITDCSGCHR